MFKLVKEIRSKEGILHFKRWSIISTKWLSVYIHYINQADEDKHLHDHPWSFWSVILKGGYIELTESGRNHRRFLHMAFRKKNTPHKIEVLIHPTWSLVITGPGGRQWGYKVGNIWIDNIAYRQMKRENKLL